MKASKRELGVWLAGYVCFLGLLAAWLWNVRQEYVAELSTPQATSDWNAWQESVKKQQDDPTLPVKRRVPKSNEPPHLLLLRDHFAAVLVTLLLVATIFYTFFALVIRGLWTSSPNPSQN